MAMLKFCFYLLVMLTFIVIGLVFSFRNQTLVNVDLLFYQFSSFSIGIWLLSALIVGVLLGIGLVYPNRIFQNFRIKRLSKKVSESRSESIQSKAESNKGH